MGLGIINETHRKNLLQIPDVRISAVWDFLPERARDVAAQIGSGCKTYKDYRDLIEHAGVDCIYIAVPPHRHEEHEILASRRGIPFLVEKPIVRHLSQARAIEREILRSGVLHAVGYHNRYAPHIDFTREALDGAVVGMALGFTFWKNVTERNQPRWHHWLFDDALGGGQLHEHTTHVFDLARYLVGEVRRVFCQRTQRVPHDEITNYATSDVNSVLLEFENGALGIVGAAHMTPRPYWWGLNVLTDRNIVEYNERQVRVLIEDRATEMTPSMPNGIHFFEDSTFIEAVRRNDRSLIRSTYSDAIRTTAVSLAAIESSKRGQPVEVSAILAAGEK
jgi:predicted dehydrogenase